MKRIRFIGKNLDKVDTYNISRYLRRDLELRLFLGGFYGASRKDFYETN